MRSSYTLYGTIEQDLWVFTIGYRGQAVHCRIQIVAVNEKLFSRATFLPAMTISLMSRTWLIVSTGASKVTSAIKGVMSVQTNHYQSCCSGTVKPIQFCPIPLQTRWIYSTGTIWCIMDEGEQSCLSGRVQQQTVLMIGKRPRDKMCIVDMSSCNRFNRNCNEHINHTVLITSL